MDYFYTPPRLITAPEAIIEGDEFTHLTHVMRKKVGEEIMIVDGAGNAYRTQIADLSKRAARCTIRQHVLQLHEPATEATLAIGILKNPSRFDFLVEKATELGATHIVPLLTERTIPRHAKTDRWQKIALAAMKQSERCVLPTIHPLTLLGDFLRTATAEQKFIAHEQANTPLDVDVHAASVAVCIGPEGGFTEGEIAEASGNGFQTITLGVRRLRTETAGIVALSRMIR
jgi:16S rRNA (uracil1498-N3)-methyltransferase